MNQQPKLIKIMVVGEAECGKTTFLNTLSRLSNAFFSRQADNLSSYTPPSTAPSLTGRLLGLLGRPSASLPTQVQTEQKEEEEEQVHKTLYTNLVVCRVEGVGVELYDFPSEKQLRHYLSVYYSTISFDAVWYVYDASQKESVRKKYLQWLDVLHGQDGLLQVPHQIIGLLKTDHPVPTQPDLAGVFNPVAGDTVLFVRLLANSDFKPLRDILQALGKGHTAPLLSLQDNWLLRAEIQAAHSYNPYFYLRRQVVQLADILDTCIWRPLRRVVSPSHSLLPS